MIAAHCHRCHARDTGGQFCQKCGAKRLPTTWRKFFIGYSAFLAVSSLVACIGWTVNHVDDVERRLSTEMMRRDSFTKAELSRLILEGVELRRELREMENQ